MAWLVLQFGKHFKEKPIRSVRFWGISLTVGLLIGAVFAAYAVPAVVARIRPPAISQGPCPSSLKTLPSLAPLNSGNVADLRELNAMDVSGVLAVAVPGDGQRFAVATRQGMCLYEWETMSGRFQLFQTPVTTAAFSLDGHLLAVGTTDGFVGVWDTQSDVQVRWRVPVHSGPVTSLAFSPDGRWLASAGRDQALRLWDALYGEQSGQFEKQAASLNDVVFSPDGRLACAGNDGLVGLWNVHSHLLETVLRGHAAAVTALAFSADGEQLVSGSKDKTIRLWNTLTGVETRRFVGHDDWVMSLAMSPDGRLLVSGSEDHTIRIWEVETGAQLRVLTGHSAAVNDVAFSPVGNLLISSSTDGTVRLWGVLTK